MEIKDMTIEQIEERKAEIRSLCETEDADLNALTEEVRQLNEELEARKNAEAQREEIRKAVAAGAGEVKEKIEEVKSMTNEEIRSSAAYAEAFANYLKTGEDKECRALLTEQVSGTVPVPKIVDGIIRTAWDSEPLLSRVRKTYIRGNLKVAFERSADPAYVHTEGTSAAAYGMAIVKNCPHRAAAEALVNFMTSAEGQSAIAAYEEGTLRLTNANYVVPEGAWLEASADMTWVPRPVNELIERKAELLEHWNELVGQIQG